MKSCVDRTDSIPFQAPPANSPLKGEGRGTNDESEEADEKPKVKAESSDEKPEVKAKSSDKKPEVKAESSGSGLVRKCFGSEDLRTKPEAYTRSKILELEHEVKSLKGSTRVRDQDRLCKFKYSLKIFKNKK